MKVLFKTFEFIFFKFTILILISVFKVLNFIVFSILDFTYSLLIKLDNLVSKICFSFYFHYVYRFLKYLWSFSQYLLPELKKKCQSYLFTPILIVKILFGSNKTEKTIYKNCSTSLIEKNKRITNNYKSSLFCCIVKRAC